VVVAEEATLGNPISVEAQLIADTRGELLLGMNPAQTESVKFPMCSAWLACWNKEHQNCTFKAMENIFYSSNNYESGY
jgi:hypothetical protein